MLIYVNGDSHSAGHDAGGINASYGFHLSTFLKTQFHCDATPGCANDTILRTTRNYLKTSRPDCVIIGWTSWDREEWTYNGNPVYVTSSGFDSVPKKLQTQYKQWVVESVKPEKQKEKELYWHHQIYQFHLELTKLGMPHLFFNCYSYFHYIKHWNLSQYDWSDNYINPYDENYTYYFWLERKGFQPVNPKFYHYGPDAHRVWAEFLLPPVSRLLTNI
jgi:hypothetical protein